MDDLDLERSLLTSAPVLITGTNAIAHLLWNLHPLTRQTTNPLSCQSVSVIKVCFIFAKFVIPAAVLSLFWPTVLTVLKLPF